MLNTKSFGEELSRYGFKFFSGVPCSFLKDLINYAINDLRYVAAANEGDAVAIASGAYVGGLKSAVLMQNSGLSNAVSPLTSLNYTFQIPVLGFVSLRGEEGLQDEPQHELLGKITPQLLETMGVAWDYLSDDIEKARQQIAQANEIIEKKQSFFFIVRKGTFEKVALKKQAIPQASNEIKVKESKSLQMPSRLDALKIINKAKEDNVVFLATTGVTGRELYEIDDAKNNLYMVGSMGCISSLGLGLALAKPEKKIIVIDGDGSLLMRMGSLATNAAYGPKNLLHILLDNGIHDSTGGQDTSSGNVSFVDVAAACGYRKAYFVHNLEELQNQIEAWKNHMSLTFIHLKIKKGTMETLGRPKIRPYEVKNRLMAFLNENVSPGLKEGNSNV
jgi:phosphonopyruvate decarboxylase